MQSERGFQTAVIVLPLNTLIYSYLNVDFPSNEMLQIVPHLNTSAIYYSEDFVIASVLSAQNLIYVFRSETAEFLALIPLEDE